MLAGPGTEAHVSEEPTPNAGLTVGGVVTVLPRLNGASRAHEMMLTMRRVDAGEGARIGLVADVVDGDALIGRAIETAEQIAALAPWGVRLTKQGMWSAMEIPSERIAVEFVDRSPHRNRLA